MEIQLQELIDRIRKEGAEAAEAEADAIISAAKAEADAIISDSKAQAKKIMLDAASENERTVRAGEDSIRQAFRNLLISFRESISRELNAVIENGVSSVYSSDALAQLIIRTVESLAGNPEADDISVILNSEDLRLLEEKILAGLKERLLAGVTLKANNSFKGGFRISVAGGTAYYDYSAEAVTDMLSDYLSPKITAILKEAE